MKENEVETDFLGRRTKIVRTLTKRERHIEAHKRLDGRGGKLTSTIRKSIERRLRRL